MNVQVRPRSDAVYLGQRRLRLSDRDLLGEGGEGRVYRVGDVAVKVFTIADARRARKLRDFPVHLPPRVVGPIELCTNAGGEIVGFAMRALDGAVDLHRLSQRRWRDGRIASGEVLRIFRDVADTVERLHLRGVIVGDLNDGNVVLTPATSSAGSLGSSTSAWTPWLIDADSMQFGAYRCVVAHERFLDPRLYGVDLEHQTALSRESDWYALAVLLFGSLLYVHPYGGAHPAHATMLRRAEARCSALRPDVKLPSAAMRPDVLPDDALEWFVRVFERDAREPLPSSVLEARFTRCSCGVEHARTSCPVCAVRVHVAPVVRARGQIRATRVFSTLRGRIVAAVVQNGLKHAVESEGVLVREDGAIVLREDGASPENADPIARSYFRDPNRVVRIAGIATWVGVAGRAAAVMAKVVGERVVFSIPVGRAHNEPAGDAGLGGLVHIQGDALLRAESGTRIGQILENQTRVRMSEALGFAFYRAGELTVAFVFDPRRGPLRQIDSFPRIEGKLLGWSAVFSETHVLVTVATEKNGRIEHAATLVDASGGLLATEKGSGSSPLTSSLTGRAVAGGNVLVASEDGLVLLRADRSTGSFVPARLFPEASSLAPPDAELLVGPGGSLFVVTHDEITHLCFHSQ